MEKIPKTDVWGNPVYKRAVGGELKKAKEGNLILKADPAEEEKTPASETVSYHFRTAPYIKGEAEPDDLSLWDAALVPDYLTEQVMGMLGQLGYRQITEDGAPWAYIQIDPINGEAAGQILEWYTDCLLYPSLTGQSVNIGSMLFFQVFFGIGCGVLFGKSTAVVLNQVDFDIAQGKTILVFAAAILAYTVPSMIGGNGYLSGYLCGIILGNSYLPHKRDMVLFFDVLTGVAQMMIFFLLGLLVTPSELPQVILPSLVIMIFLTFVGRPVSVAALLAGFRSSKGQIGLVSWAGMRGVDSIVFAIYVVLRQVHLGYNLFNLVFCIVLLSISIQGTLLPWISAKFQMIDENADVRRTFNDYQEEESISFVKFHLYGQHPYVGKCLKEITLPPKLLVVLLILSLIHISRVVF